MKPIRGAPSNARGNIFAGDAANNILGRLVELDPAAKREGLRPTLRAPIEPAADRA